MIIQSFELLEWSNIKDFSLNLKFVYDLQNTYQIRNFIAIPVPDGVFLYLNLTKNGCSVGWSFVKALDPANFPRADRVGCTQPRTSFASSWVQCCIRRAIDWANFKPFINQQTDYSACRAFPAWNSFRLSSHRSVPEYPITDARARPDFPCIAIRIFLLPT